MISVVGDQLTVSGPMTMAAAAVLTSEGAAALGEASKPLFDLSAVTELDSSSLAVVFAWMRAAKLAGKSISILNAPPGLLSLAAVYGVADLLPQN